MKIFFFFFLNLENLTFSKELKILDFFKNFFLLFFFFEKIWKSWIFYEGIENFDWWFFFEKFRNLEFFQGTENFNFFFFLEINLRSTSLMPLVPRPFLKILSFFFFLKICSLSKKSEKDEDDDGVKVMKIIYSWWFFFFGKTYPLNENNFGWKSMWITG